ncbi:hypothetical protein DYB32_010812 [Aphanomyces invadans]|uniref:Uncharacterized protein n=1 Tax=Aphanomyces invadans TaxID=157072 RepID=A0A3R6WDG8_9STRA|nr:hypothetical protein DYB32_010812 [Aphanomyces invadans]
MLGVNRESRLSSGSVDDLTTAAQAGLFLLAQNNDLQVQIGELNDRVGHQAHELELAAAKYDACWRQRCHAMQEVADVLKENHELQRDLRLANAHIVKLEDDVSKLESRVHVAESALNRLMHNNKTIRPPGRPQTKWSEPESTLSIQNWQALPTMAEPAPDPPNQDDSIHEGNEDPFATEPPSSTLSVGSPHGQDGSKLDGSVSLDELYQKSVAALATQTQQMQEMQLEQAEERELIASMRQTIAQLKQVSSVWKVA